MKKIIITVILTALYSCSDSAKIEGLTDEVEVLRDNFGINHIYANNQDDMFFMQGYLAAKDRLFQFEIWRRQATGTVSEIFGEEELDRDIGTRLFKFRGNIKEDLNHYHEDGYEIVSSFVAGVNKYIEEVNNNPELLPIEFKVLGIKPDIWTNEVVISRHQGLLGNISQELNIGRAVSLIGEKKVKELMWFHPKEPSLELDKTITYDDLKQDILKLYNAYRRPIKFKSEYVLEKYRSKDLLANVDEPNIISDRYSIGSNNWVLDGTKTADGHTYMANDPHRRIAIPSLRYMAHLVAPGWNVIGGGEPEIPGISIGHNEYGAWGLTVFRTDGEDLYQYELNPKNPLQYKFQGVWKDFKVIREIIVVKGGEDLEVELYYSHHGPVTYLNKKALKAYAVRCAWLEPGGSPYLASLRMDQAKTWEEFRNACSYSNIPGENMIWADKQGNIGWQAVGIAPVRKNFSGLVPVLGDGRYEWDGYLPILEKPNAANPEKGYIATANQNVTPADYTRWDAIGYSWSDPYRGKRIDEVLGTQNDFTMEDMKALQVDVTSLPARTLIPLLETSSLSPREEALKTKLMSWDFKLEPNSIAAAIYNAWEKEIIRHASAKFIPEVAKPYLSSLQLKRILDWIETPGTMFRTIAERDVFLQTTFQAAVADL